MAKRMILENIEYNFKTVTISKKIKGHKIFQKFIDGYYSALNENFKNHLKYVSRYLDENLETFVDINVIHYVALNFGYLYTHIAVKLLHFENQRSILSSALLNLFQNNFSYLHDDMKERGYDCLISYFICNPCDQICNENSEVDSCNEDNEIFFRRFLMTAAKRYSYLDKIGKRQLKKNIAHFNSSILNFKNQVSLLITTELIEADKAMREEYDNWPEIAISKTPLQ